MEDTQMPPAKWGLNTKDWRSASADLSVRIVTAVFVGSGIGAAFGAGVAIKANNATVAILCTIIVFGAAGIFGNISPANNNTYWYYISRVPGAIYHHMVNPT